MENNKDIKIEYEDEFDPQEDEKIDLGDLGDLANPDKDEDIDFNDKLKDNTDFKCPMCGSKEYGEKRETNGVLGPGHASWVVSYYCKGCSVHFNGPEAFMKHNEILKSLDNEDYDAVPSITEERLKLLLKLGSVEAELAFPRGGANLTVLQNKRNDLLLEIANEQESSRLDRLDIKKMVDDTEDFSERWAEAVEFNKVTEQIREEESKKCGCGECECEETSDDFVERFMNQYGRAINLMMGWNKTDEELMNLSEKEAEQLRNLNTENPEMLEIEHQPFEIEIIGEHGYDEAIYGLGLSHGVTSDMSFDYMSEKSDKTEMLDKTAGRLCDKDGGHNKFLESMVVWLNIRAPRYWWQEFDTYRVGMTKQSESTMHTLTKQDIDNSNFAFPVRQSYIEYLRELASKASRGFEESFLELKNALPEGFLQRRIVCTNYKCLKNIIEQRKKHRLPEWRCFVDYLINRLDYRELLTKGK